MMKLASAVIAMGILFTAGPLSAQAPRTLDGFVAEANRIPLNASSAFRPSAYRLKGEVERAFGTVRGEVASARAAGQTPPACPPERITLSPQQLLGFLNAIPQERRQRMSVPDGIRAWLASRYPCPA